MAWPSFMKKNRMRHGGIVPLLAVPDFIHGGGVVSSRGSRVSRPAGRYWPVIFFRPIYGNRHLLFGLVDADQDGRAGLFSSGIGLRLRAPRLGFGFRGRSIALRARGGGTGAGFWRRWTGRGRPGAGGAGAIGVGAGLRPHRKSEYRRRNGTITRLRKCLGEITRYTS
jgi:hypothetical protein